MLEICPNCSNVLEYNLKLKKYVCNVCGWSELTLSEHDEDLDYVG